MSHSSHSYVQHAGAPPPRVQSAAAVSRHVHRTHGHPTGDYMLVHGGRQVRIGPVVFWIVVGTLVVMGIWAIATGTYFAFHDDVLTRLVGRQAELQFAYEDRIAELRAQVDRVTSRQLLDQQQFEKKLNTLLQRQAVLEQRTSALGGEITTGSIRPARNALPAEISANKPHKASPISDTVIFSTPPDREARLESREVSGGMTRLASRGDTGGLDGILGRVSAGLDKIDRRQTAALTDMEERMDSKARRMLSVLSELGVDPSKTSAHAGTGGPFVPFKAPRAGASAFDRQLYRINVARAG